MYKSILKRLLDIFLSFAALVVLFPILALIAGLIRWKLGGPVFFKQQRPGKDNRIFTMYKFRTMTNQRDENGTLLPDGVRLTPFGRFLRSTSLDELPELWNILKGDMSLVGPRPLLVEYLPRYNKEQLHRHDVRPGLTGWAQVNGRNAISWDEKFRLDIQYVDGITFRKDFQILWMTARNVFKREGISSQNSETMEVFLGNHSQERLVQPVETQHISA